MAPTIAAAMTKTVTNIGLRMARSDSHIWPGDGVEGALIEGRPCDRYAKCPLRISPSPTERSVCHRSDVRMRSSAPVDGDHVHGGLEATELEGAGRAPCEPGPGKGLAAGED